MKGILIRAVRWGVEGSQCSSCHMRSLSPGSHTQANNANNGSAILFLFSYPGWFTNSILRVAKSINYGLENLYSVGLQGGDFSGRNN